MSCTDYAINEVVNGGDISDYVLELAFTNPNQNISNNWYSVPNTVSVEQGIREKVIHATVLPRCNIQGGVTETIDLTGSQITHLGQNKAQVQVPDFLTGGRKIISVPEVYQGSINSSAGITPFNSSGVACGEGTMNHQLAGFIQGLRSNNSMPQTFTNNQVLGNNVFIIHGCPPGMFSLTARVLLESDDSMNHINPAAYPYFAILVNLAVKAYIYKNVRNRINEGVLKGGVNVDSIKDEVYGYSDAWKEYQDYFEEQWIKYMKYSDKDRKFRSINNQIQRRT